MEKSNEKQHVSTSDNAARREDALGTALKAAHRERTTSRDTLRRTARASHARMSVAIDAQPTFEFRVQAPSTMNGNNEGAVDAVGPA